MLYYIILYNIISSYIILDYIILYYVRSRPLLGLDAPGPPDPVHDDQVAAGRLPGRYYLLLL